MDNNSEVVDKEELRIQKIIKDYEFNDYEKECISYAISDGDYKKYDFRAYAITEETTESEDFIFYIKNFIICCALNFDIYRKFNDLLTSDIEFLRGFWILVLVIKTEYSKLSWDESSKLKYLLTNFGHSGKVTLDYDYASKILENFSRKKA